MGGRTLDGSGANAVAAIETATAASSLMAVVAIGLMATEGPEDDAVVVAIRRLVAAVSAMLNMSISVPVTAEIGVTLVEDGLAHVDVDNGATAAIKRLGL